MGKKLGGSESRFLPQKCARTRLHASAISKFFQGYISDPVKMGKGGMGWGLGKGKERRGKEGEGRN
jgi:hypothetical protein